MNPSAIPTLPLPAPRPVRVVPPSGVWRLLAPASTPLYDLQCWISSGGDPFTGHRPTVAHAHAGIVAHSHGVTR